MTVNGTMRKELKKIAVVLVFGALGGFPPIREWGLPPL